MKISRMAGLALTAAVWLALVQLSQTTGLATLALTGYAAAMVYVREREQRYAWTLIAVVAALLIRRSGHGWDVSLLAVSVTIGVFSGIVARAVRVVVEQIESRRSHDA